MKSRKAFRYLRCGGTSSFAQTRPSRNARGEKSPFAEDAFEKTATTRAAILKAVEDSITYCDAAYAALDDRKAAEMIDGAFGSGQTARAAALMGNSGHVQEHYGNLVTYMRINGVVPPSSQPR